MAGLAGEEACAAVVEAVRRVVVVVLLEGGLLIGLELELGLGLGWMLMMEPALSPLTEALILYAALVLARVSRPPLLLVWVRSKQALTPFLLSGSRQ